MTTTPESTPRATPLTRPFPDGGPRLRQAYRELSIAANGTSEQVNALGDLRLLPRPWDPPSCTQPQLRGELWVWLEDVVTWLNREHVWDVTAVIPACWPQHPHLVHEIAVLADQRRRAGLALNSDPMEEWHRYCLPAFTDRMKARVKTSCEQGHQPWPAKGRYTRHTSKTSQDQRATAYAADIQITEQRPGTHDRPGPPRLTVVDLDTGEIKDTEP